MNELTSLCKVDQVKEGAPVAINLENFPALGVYKHGDNYYVIDNICTHGLAILTDGYQEGDEIECPFHGGAFDLKTGEAISFPCEKPVKSYPVTIQNDTIFISAALGDG
jgi:ethylbenzene dioxygenase ferredoxin subunit